MNKRAIFSTAAKAAVSALILYVVFRSVRPDQLVHDLGNLDGGRLALIVLLSWFGQLFCVQRWRIFSSGLGMAGRYGHFLRMYFAGMFFNVGFPSLVGGDLVKAYLVSRYAGRPLQRGLASVLQDRAAGLISLLIAGSVAAGFCSLTWRDISLPALYLIAWVGLAAVLWLAWKGGRLYEPLLKPGTDSLAQKALRLLADFHRGLIGMRLAGGETMQVVACSFANAALSIWLLQQIGAAAGHPIPLLAFAAMLPLITLATLLPVTWSGLGIREWAYIEALGLLGVPSQAALVVALTTSALLVVADLGGAVFLPAVRGAVTGAHRLTERSDTGDRPRDAAASGDRQQL